MNAEDSALRDFSAICLREFLRWTIKQATKEVGLNELKVCVNSFDFCF